MLFSESLEGKPVYIENDSTGEYIGEHPVGKLIANYGLAQVVYRFRAQGKDLVIKILRENKQGEFSFSGEKKSFSEVEFYGVCIDALKNLEIEMPETSAAIKIRDTRNERNGLLGFLQSYIEGPIIEDRKTVNLPDLGLIAGENPRGTQRQLDFQEGFYLPERGITLFADWDKYFHQLKLIAERIGVHTRDDLEQFKKTIISSM